MTSPCSLNHSMTFLRWQNAWRQSMKMAYGNHGLSDPLATPMMG